MTSAAPSTVRNFARLAASWPRTLICPGPARRASIAGACDRCPFSR
jgi:hypothetical protein